MSYINEINGFHKWVQTHPELPTSARILWFTLMHYNNSCGWKRVFNVPISLLMGDSGLSRSSIVRARKLLQESGRIRYTTRSDMKATEYELLPMSDEPGIATGYDTYNTRRDTEHDTGYDKGYATERDTLHDTVYDTKDDTVYDTTHDIVYDNTCDIAHDTQDGHIPRLDQTRQDQTNTIQDTNTRQDNQTRPDSLSEFSFSGGEKKENAYRSDNADMHGNIMYDDEMHDGTMYDDTMCDDTMHDNNMHDNKVYDDTVYDDNMRNNKVYDDNMHNDNMREEKIKEEEFVPPTVEMVEAYCKARGNVIDPEMFVAYYDSIGWVRGKYPMKDWKAAVRSWEKYDAEYRENGYY
ncbi:hypothetical protein [uncultured Veillonella sp.]|uniref:hypothetical protein n=1 Tax=uncultured Veillonella sp. TaxID=159268 RepID=UPI002595E76E|nr:hypothetical protein [uncultured Veillonella sp.]